MEVVWSGPMCPDLRAYLAMVLPTVVARQVRVIRPVGITTRAPSFHSYLGYTGDATLTVNGHKDLSQGISFETENDYQACLLGQLIGPVVDIF